jgi:hypothetical protein
MLRNFYWTERADEALIRMWNSEQPTSEIAQILGVSPHSVIQRACKLRSCGNNLQIRTYSPRPRNGSYEKWTQEDRDEVLRRRALGATPEAIAYYVGKTPFAIERFLPRQSQVFVEKAV